MAGNIENNGFPISYQRDGGGGDDYYSNRNDDRDGGHRRSSITAAAVAGVVFASLILLSFSSSSSSYFDYEDAGGGSGGWTLLGRSRSHGHHHQKHHHDHPSHSSDIVPKSVQGTQAEAGLQLGGYPSPEVQVEYARALSKIDWKDVEQDIETLLTSRDRDGYWPADYGNYGPLFIRLAWHSCGSYRRSDGRGGCEGGAQRFDPERSWADNTNLDKARSLLQPIKLKYGRGVSWGDLFALSGTVAIKAMGGPDPGFCPGRVDVVDNTQTIALGPSREQDKFGHCETNGRCPYPLGTNTLGLIYVNPEGPMGVPFDLQAAADTVRDVFGRMDWTGREIVALIGGGHTFGKAHGASMAANGLPPAKCPLAPWDGPKGVNAITSGFEGPWTAHPTKVRMLQASIECSSRSISLLFPLIIVFFFFCVFILHYVM